VTPNQSGYNGLEGYPKWSFCVYPERELGLRSKMRHGYATSDVWFKAESRFK